MKSTATRTPAERQALHEAARWHTRLHDETATPDAVGRYNPPPVAEMERVIDADQKKYVGHCVDRPRHTQQLDYFLYEHNMRTKEIPEGLKRARELGPPTWAGVGNAVDKVAPTTSVEAKA